MAKVYPFGMKPDIVPMVIAVASKVRCSLTLTRSRGMRPLPRRPAQWYAYTQPPEVCRCAVVVAVAAVEGRRCCDCRGCGAAARSGPVADEER
jgi:hypothetical protein